MTNHEWKETDDLVALYLHRFGPERLGMSVHEISKRLAIDPGSMKMRVQNFRAIEKGSGLAKYAAQSAEVFKRHQATTEQKLRTLAQGILGVISSVGPNLKRGPLESLQSFGFSGRAALRRVVEQSTYGSIEQAVASLSLFPHPETVRQIRGRNVFRIVRCRSAAERGKIVEREGIGPVMLDDNKGPTDAFIWAHGLQRAHYEDVQFNHLWSGPDDVESYTSLANICMMPAFLSKLSDTDLGVRALLRYRSFCLFDGYLPSGSSPLEKPAAYDALDWAETLPPVAEIEEKYRTAMRSKPKDRTTCSARQIGWIFSGFKPDSEV